MPTWTGCLLTGFAHNGAGNRLLMSVAGVVTTYTLDYGNGRQILREAGGITGVV